MAIKSVAKRAWEGTQARSHPYNTWYEPFDKAAEIEKSLRYTLSQEITAAVMPGELQLWPMIINAGKRFVPLTEKEQQEVMTQVTQYQPLAGPRMD